MILPHGDMHKVGAVDEVLPPGMMIRQIVRVELTQDISTASTSYVATPVTTSITLVSSKLLIFMCATVWIGAGGYTAFFRLNLNNGQRYIYLGAGRVVGGNLDATGVMEYVDDLSPGTYNVVVEWSCDGGAGVVISAQTYPYMHYLRLYLIELI